MIRAVRPSQNEPTKCTFPDDAGVTRIMDYHCMWIGGDAHTRPALDKSKVIEVRKLEMWEGDFASSLPSAGRELRMWGPGHRRCVAQMVVIATGEPMVGNT